MYSDRKSSTVSEGLELAIQTVLVETRPRELDREFNQVLDSDLYLFSSERAFDNAADDLEMMVVSKFSRSLLPQNEAVRIDLEPFEQDTKPLAKILCFTMEDEPPQSDELNRQLSLMKTYLKASYRLSDLLRAQRNERMTISLKRWVQNGTPDKGDLEEDS